MLFGKEGASFLKCNRQKNTILKYKFQYCGENTDKISGLAFGGSGGVRLSVMTWRMCPPAPPP